MRKTKNDRFPFSVCCTKIDTRFSVPFFAFLSNVKIEKRTVYRIFDFYRQYENRNKVCEKYCVSCVTFSTEWEKRKTNRVCAVSSFLSFRPVSGTRKTTSLTVFLIPYAVRNTNKKAVLSQRWPRNAPYIRVPWLRLQLHCQNFSQFSHSHFTLIQIAYFIWTLFVVFF